ncbi:MAG: ABC transporter ATP-binding protein [Acidobacteria bacterium]|nr:ABC transporter ATP-binding protein [Acidobacteriota bacterium]
MASAGDTPALEARDLRVRLGGREILKGVSLRIAFGEMVAVAGPNGAGKTTLLRTLVGILRPASGTVAVAGAAQASLSRRELARALAYLPQETWSEFDVTVADVVALGRYPHVGALGLLRDEDRSAIAEAMEVADVAGLARQPVTSLSGGERRRVHLARAIAQRARILVLDEPVSALDVGHACHVMALLARLAASGCAVVLSLHDLVLARRGPGRAVLLDGGEVRADGEPGAVLTGEAARRAFGVPLVAIAEPPAIVPGGTQSQAPCSSKPSHASGWAPPEP